LNSGYNFYPMYSNSIGSSQSIEIDTNLNNNQINTNHSVNNLQTSNSNSDN